MATKTYYIATDGNDNNAGSLASPFATFAKADNVARAGDIVYVRGGTYTEVVDIYRNSGTAGYPIVYEAYEDEEVIIDGINRSINTADPWASDPQFFIEEVNYVVFKKFYVKNAPAIGIKIRYNASHCTLEDCLATDNYESGISIDGTYNTLTRCEGSYNFDFLGAGGTGYGGDADGITVDGEYNELIDCIAHHNSDDGYDSYYGTYNTFTRCKSYTNGVDDGNRNRSQTGYDPELFVGAGSGFKVGPGYNYQSNSELVQCVSYDNVFGFNNNAGSLINFYNCTAYGNSDENFWLYNGSGGAKTLTLKNNISYNGTNNSTVTNKTEVTNSWNIGGLTIADSDFVSVDSSSPHFLKLSNGSQLINIGTDIGLDFVGTAPDLGAYEFTPIIPVNNSNNALSLLSPSVSVETNVGITANAMALTLSTVTSSILTTSNINITSGIGSLTFNTLQSIISGTSNITSSVANLNLNSIASEISAICNVEIGAIASNIVLSSETPNVETIQNAIITSNTSNISLAAISLNISISGSVEITSNVSNIGLSTLSPNVSAIQNAEIGSNVSDISLSALTHTINAIQNAEINHNVSNIDFNLLESVVSANSNVLFATNNIDLNCNTPNLSSGINITGTTQDISLNALSPDVSAIGNANIQANVYNAQLVGNPPTLVTSINITCTTSNLDLRFRNPSIPNDTSVEASISNINLSLSNDISINCGTTISSQTTNIALVCNISTINTGITINATSSNNSLSMLSDITVDSGTEYYVELSHSERIPTLTTYERVPALTYEERVLNLYVTSHS